MTINRIATFVVALVLGTALNASAQSFPRKGDPLDPMSRAGSTSSFRISQPTPVTVVRYDVNIKVSRPRVVEYVRYYEPVVVLPAPTVVRVVEVPAPVVLTTDVMAAYERAIEARVIARILAAR